MGSAARAASRAMCTGGFLPGVFPGVKAAEGLMSIASRAEVKNEWSHTSAPSICLDGLQRDDFTFRNAQKLYCNLLTF